MFTGTYESRVDSKNCVALPDVIVEQLKEEEIEPSHLHLLMVDGILRLYSQKGYKEAGEILYRNVVEEKERTYQEKSMLRRFFGACNTDYDNQHKVRVPENMLKHAKIANDSEVLIIGCIDHCEIWPKTDYELMLKWEKLHALEHQIEKLLEEERKEQDHE